MLTYWFLFMFPAIAALLGRDRGPKDPRYPVKLTPPWIVFGIVLVVIIGLRYQVGGDWYNYLGHLEEARGESWSSLVMQSDPGYKLLNALSLSLGWEIYGVNTVAALIFSAGLIAFCRRLPKPWLASAVAVPYLVIVVAMGYSRQGMALGFSMLGLLALERKAAPRFAGWVVTATLFHRSAMLLLPIAALTATRKRVWIAFWIGVIGVIAYLAFLEREASYLYTQYFERGYESQGAFIRLGMNSLAAVLFLLLNRSFHMSPESTSLWRWISYLSLLLMGAYFVSPGSSAALDRLGLYLLPLQLVVYSYLPGVLGGRQKKLWVTLVLFYCALVLFVWLNFASNVYAWLPYRNIILE
ncbi:EpsG family protein [Dokdonella immobilis]|uniref:EpsG family protein n=1 Tax=Dokdonella immobilis TaxID=578942 RepID=A0A1I4Y125_9GAMM|nr:EpsG family protein [Dokdonella immobilis]SFN31716.1 EpsG family protein [Dokdonella immobilis]